MPKRAGGNTLKWARHVEAPTKNSVVTSSGCLTKHHELPSANAFGQWCHHARSSGNAAEIKRLHDHLIDKHEEFSIESYLEDLDTVSDSLKLGEVGEALQPTLSEELDHGPQQSNNKEGMSHALGVSHHCGVTGQVDNFMTLLTKCQQTPGTNATLSSEPLTILQRLQSINEQLWFHTAIAVSTSLNAVQMGIEVDAQDGVLRDVVLVFEHIFGAIFLFEMIIKLLAMQRSYFFDAWNCIDCTLVAISILDLWILGLLFDGNSNMHQLSVLRVLKIVRVVRMVRLLHVCRELWLIVQGLMKSTSTIFWVGLLLTMILYGTAVLLTQQIGHNEDFRSYVPTEGEYATDISVEQYFGSIPRTMFTLLNIVFMSGDYDVVSRTVFEVRPVFFFALVIFILFTTFGIMNVIIGAIVDNTMDVATHKDLELQHNLLKLRMKVLHELKEMCFACDGDGDGFITVDKLSQGFENNLYVKDQFESMVQLPIGVDVRELFDMLDSEGSGRITHRQFMKSMYRLVEQNDQQMLRLCSSLLNRVERETRRALSRHPGHSSNNSSEWQLQRRSSRGNVLSSSGSNSALDRGDGLSNGDLAGSACSSKLGVIEKALEDTHRRICQRLDNHDKAIAELRQEVARLPLAEAPLVPSGTVSLPPAPPDCSQDEEHQAPSTTAVLAVGPGDDNAEVSATAEPIGYELWKHKRNGAFPESSKPVFPGKGYEESPRKALGGSGSESVIPFTGAPRKARRESGSRPVITGKGSIFLDSPRDAPSRSAPGSEVARSGLSRSSPIPMPRDRSRENHMLQMVDNIPCGDDNQAEFTSSTPEPFPVLFPPPAAG